MSTSAPVRAPCTFQRKEEHKSDLTSCPVGKGPTTLYSSPPPLLQLSPPELRPFPTDPARLTAAECLGGRFLPPPPWPMCRAGVGRF